MKLSQIKTILRIAETVNFQLPNKTFVPAHFHVTEVGVITKKFIDCGGTVRNETLVNFQLWNANDIDHKLKPQRLLEIIELSEKVLVINDFEIEVEYQDTTIGKYDLAFNGNNFELLNKKTNCLAIDKCGIPIEKQIKKAVIDNNESCCLPGGNCC